MTIIDDQLQAYSERDLEKFLSCYTDDIQVFMLEQGKMITDGIEQLESIMSAAFKSTTASKTTVISQIEQNNLIVNHERIIGHEEGKAILTISIYQITDDKISKLWFGGRSTEDL